MANLNQIYDVPTLVQIIAQERSLADSSLTQLNAQNIALRCALRALLAHLTNLRQFLVNNAASLPVGNPPNVPSWPQVVTIIKNLIDNETDPTT